MTAFTLLHADDALLVADKPAGLLAVPGRGEAGLDNLWSRICTAWPGALVVHRLDMATSGLLLFARHVDAQRALGDAFARREVGKRYVAVVEGEVPDEAGEIDAPLIADWPNRPRQVVDPVAGKPALTRWQVLQRGAGWTRLALQPVTGRSHQLRVHLQHIGHPVRGDTLYAPQPVQAHRLLLHAQVLELVHPASGARVRYESAVPF